MKILDLEQGSDEWLEVRLNHYTASEAPAMMGDSKFMSRNQLLALKKGWQNNPDDTFKTRLFQKGHEYEAAAREIIETEHCGNFTPVVASSEIESLTLLASYDGLYLDTLPWEHKSWNETLSENVRNGLITAEYYWQLEHQMLVADVDKILFTVSDGTQDKKIDLIYRSSSERREQLIAGWQQFGRDLEEYEITARPELPEAREVESFPVVIYQINGSNLTSNIEACLQQVKSRAQIEMSRELETDQDFADKEQLNKAVKAARQKLKTELNSAQRQFVSFSEFATLAADLDSVLQKMQSHGEKQVKDAKEKVKAKIKTSAESRLREFIFAIYKEIQPIKLLDVYQGLNPQFDVVMKNKRTIESLQAAVDQELADAKIKMNEVKDLIILNLASLREHAEEYKFLFADINALVTKDNEALVAIIKQRIADHVKAEQEKLAIKREQAEAKQRLKDQQAVEAEQRRIKQEPQAKTEKAEETPQPEPDTPEIPNQHEQSNLSSRLSKWGIDNAISDQALRELAEILQEYNITGIKHHG